MRTPQINGQLSPSIKEVSEGTKAFGLGASASQIAMAKAAIQNSQGVLAQVPPLLDYCTAQAVNLIGPLHGAADGAADVAQLVNPGSAAAQLAAGLRSSIDAGVADPYNPAIGCKQQEQWSDGSWHDCLSPAWLHKVQQCVGAAAQAVASAQPPPQPKPAPRPIFQGHVLPVIFGHHGPLVAPMRFGFGQAQSLAVEAHAAMRANARKAISDYLSLRPNALNLHRVFLSSRVPLKFVRRKVTSSPVGLGDTPSICPGTALTSEYQAAVAEVVSSAPSGLPLGGTTLDASLVAQSACSGADQLINNTTLGFSISKAQLQTAIGVTVDAENVATAVGDIISQVAQNGFDWHSASAVASDASAAVGGIVAILVATSAITAGTGLVVSAAVGLVVFAVSVLGSLLSKPSPCQSAVWTDTRTGNTYPGRIERLCVSGNIIPGPSDNNWRAFPTPNDILFGFGGWFDLPHGNINLKDRSASWGGLTLSSDDNEAHNWRPIDLAFGDYRRLECEALAGPGNHPWVEGQSWSAEQKSAVYAFMAYFFEMWKKAAESRLNGLPADWRNMLASAILHWNMAHQPGTAGPLLVHASSGKPADFTQQGDCGSILNSASPPLFLMLASDAYSGTSLNDSDPGGNPGFFSGQDGQGTYLFLHTGDSRANGFHLAPGDIHHIHVVQPATTGSASAPSSTASKVAVGTVAAAGATAAGIGVYAWMHGIAYSYAVGKAYDATIGKVVDKAKKALRGR